MRRIGGDVVDELRCIKGTASASIFQEPPIPQIAIQVDRAATARYGINVSDDTSRPSIAPSPAGSLVKAASCSSRALYLFVKRLSFLLEPRDLRFWHIGVTQLIEHLADGKFVYFSHSKILYAWVD
jgi:hypothetical protein